MFNQLISIPRSLRFPAICSLCNQFHKSKLAVCDFCINQFTPIGHSCPRCAYPLANNEASNASCGLCIKSPPHFDTAYVHYRYQEPLRSLLHEFKYQNGLYLASMLSHIMLPNYQRITPKPDCLIPVPMHTQKLRQRGFNQAVVLCKLLAKNLNLPMDFNSCSKIKNTASQANLKSGIRKNNLYRAFHCQPLPYEHIMLVDDLLTTGNTANELAKALKKVGVKRVDIWCCARTIYE